MGRDPRREIEQLFRAHGKGVGSYVLARVGDPELAEEITSRVFLTVVRCYHQQRGSVLGWLWAIVRSEVARYFRDRRPQISPSEDLPAPLELPPDELARRELHDCLRTAMGKLSEEQQQLLGLKFFLNLRNQEIAEATGLTPSNVGVKLHRALRELRELLNGPASVHFPQSTQGDMP
ncbi:MAG TPA: sigma-70 family RNA polymerase sigma factor [Gemmataceae bacterium]|nr:sigma-70 family RNA polymerase sigma factor [Gemmataceae bacterium]